MKRKTKINYEVLIVCFLGFAFGIAARRLAPAAPGFLNLLGFLALGFLLLYLHLLLHEAGHLLFGLATGYRFLSFRISSLLWVKMDGRIRLKRLSSPLMSVQCLMAPPELKNGTMPAVLYYLGGCILTLIAAALSSVLLFAFPAWPPLLRVALLEFSFLGVLIFVENALLPEIGGLPTDGKNALERLRHPTSVRGMWLQLKVHELSTDGTRMKDMPAEWFAEPSGEEDKAAAAMLLVYRTFWLMDRSEFAAAHALTEQLTGGAYPLSKLLRFLLLCDGACCEMLGAAEGGLLAALHNEDMKAVARRMQNSITVIRTRFFEALLVRRDRAAADELRKKLDSMKQTYPSKGDYAEELALAEAAETAAGLVDRKP